MGYWHLATYRVIKLLAYSVRDSIHKVLMDCNKFHLAELYATDYKSLFVHGIVGMILAYLNCHTYIVFVVVFILVSRFRPCSNLFVSSQWFETITHPSQ